MNDSAGGAQTALFDIFGECIAVHTDDPALGARIAAALEPFRVAQAADPCAVFHVAQRDHDSPARAGQQFNNGTLLVIADRHKLITASLGTPPWQVYIEGFRRSDEYTYYYLFDPLLLMILKRRGLVHWHGAAVRHAGRDVLVVGEGGTGKSTTTLCLLMHGAGFIADDEVFLQCVPGGVRARGAERYVHCTDETLALLGGRRLRDLPLVRRGARHKRRVDAAQLGGNCGDGAASPAPIGLMLFPRVAPAALTELRPLAASEAMRRLILQRPKEHPAVIPDAPSLQRQFATCAALAETAAAFEVALGRDIECLPELVAKAGR